MRAKIKALAEDKFIKNNTIYFLGSLLVAFFSYLYHPILGRMMPVADFGEVQTLLSLVAQTGVFLGIFNVIVVNIVANAQGDAEKLKIISRLYRFALFVSLSFALLLALSSPWLESFFNFHSFWPFISLAVIIAISVSFTFRRAYLQAVRDFWAVSIAGIIGTAGRLIFAIILVYLGFSSFGAISAIVLADLLIMLFVFQKTRERFSLKLEAQTEKPRGLKRELKYGFLIFCASGFVTFLYTSDILIVKHYFPATEAGLYSGIATIARAIFFITGSVAGVLLPSIKIRNSFTKNHRIFKKALALITLIGGTTGLTFSLFSDTVIRYSIGTKYTQMAEFLPKMSLFLFLVSVINLFFVYFLALREYLLIPIAFLSGLLIAGLSFFRHENLNTVINNFLFSSIFTLVWLLLLYWKRSRKVNASNIVRTN